MSIDLTDEQIQAVRDGKPVRIVPPDLGREVVVVPAEVFKAMQDELDDEREQAAFRAFARKQAERLARENPY
jgi:hypothetical protein